MAEIKSEPEFSSLIIDDEISTGRVSPRPRRGRRFDPWWIAVIVLAIAIMAGVYWWRQQQAAPAPPLTVTEAAPTKTEAPPAKAAPAIRYPIEDARARAGLADSADDHGRVLGLSERDALLRSALSGVPGATAFDRFIYPEDMVRRFVATIDNLPRKSVAPQVALAKPVPGGILVAGADGTLSISGDNAARYASYVRFAQSVDSKTLVALYVRFYPWFQQTYQELGYPTGYFNDRLIDVIDNLLAAPETTAPIGLVQPHVLYEFANPDFEALSAGQKIMVRMGPENASQAKSKLRELRRMLTGVVAPS